MKKLVSVLCLIPILFALSSCKDNDVSSPPENDATETHISKESVPEFISLLKDLEPSGLIDGYQVNYAACYNVTPLEVSLQTDMKIFKFSDSGASFVMLDNEIYTLCVSFGGYGFVNATTCDFNNDGYKDLLVASSWGSGMHRSIISIFDSATKESSILYDTSTTDTPDVDLIVRASMPSFSSVSMENLPIYYEVLSAKIKVTDNNLANLSYFATDIVGTIQVQNGTPAFISYQE